MSIRISRIFFFLLLLTGLSTVAGYSNSESEQFNSVSIKIIDEVLLKGAHHSKWSHDSIIFSSDGKKLAILVSDTYYVVEVKDIKDSTKVKKIFSTSDTSHLRQWVPDNKSIIIEDRLYRPNEKQEDIFIIVNTVTNDSSKYPITKKSKSYNEALWYMIKTSDDGKININHPEDIEKDNALLKEGMVPYLVNQKKDQGFHYRITDEENEVWIKTKNKDIKILDKIGGIYERELSLKGDRLLIFFEVVGSRNTKKKACIYDLNTNGLYDLPQGGENYTWSPDGDWLLYSKSDKLVSISRPESEFKRIQEGEIPYFDWEATSYSLSDLFLTSWDGKKTIQLTKDKEGEKTITLEGPAAWSKDNKIAFIYTSFKYEEIEQPKEGTYLILKNAIPSYGIKLAEVLFEEKK